MNKEILRDPNMTINEIVLAMSEDNEEASLILNNLLSDPRNILKVLSLDSLGIRGDKICKLYNICSNENINKFYQTIRMLNCGVFSSKKIHDNLSLENPVSFIDEETDDSSMNPGDLGFDSDKWREYCKEQNQIFDLKYKEELTKEKNKEMISL